MSQTTPLQAQITPLQAAATIEGIFGFGKVTPEVLKVLSTLRRMEPEKIEQLVKGVKFLTTCSDPNRALEILQPGPTLAERVAKTTSCCPVAKRQVKTQRPQKAKGGEPKLCKFGLICNNSDCTFVHLEETGEDSAYYLHNSWVVQVENKMIVCEDNHGDVKAICHHCIGGRCNGSKHTVDLYVQYHPELSQRSFWPKDKQRNPLSSHTLELHHPDEDLRRLLASAKRNPINWKSFNEMQWDPTEDDVDDNFDEDARNFNTDESPRFYDEMP